MELLIIRLSFDYSIPVKQCAITSEHRTIYAYDAKLHRWIVDSVKMGTRKRKRERERTMERRNVMDGATHDSFMIFYLGGFVRRGNGSVHIRHALWLNTIVCCEPTNDARWHSVATKPNCTRWRWTYSAEAMRVKMGFWCVCKELKKGLWSELNWAFWMDIFVLCENANIATQNEMNSSIVLLEMKFVNCA